MKSDMLKALNIITASLNKLTDRELEKLMNGEGSLVFVEKKAVVAPPKEEPAIHPIISQLKGATSRTEATTLLSQKSILKKDLVHLATLLHVHINKSSNKAKIIEKIVEATVGATIRSKAIKETSFDR